MTRWHAVWVCPRFAAARRVWASATIDVVAPWPEGPPPPAAEPAAPGGAWAEARAARAAVLELFTAPTAPFAGDVRTIWLIPTGGDAPPDPTALRPHPLVPDAPGRVLNGDVLMALGVGGGPQFYRAGGTVPFFNLDDDEGLSAAAFRGGFSGSSSPLSSQTLDTRSPYT